MGNTFVWLLPINVLIARTFNHTRRSTCAYGKQFIEQYLHQRAHGGKLHVNILRSTCWWETSLYAQHFSINVGPWKSTLYDNTYVKVLMGTNLVSKCFDQRSHGSQLCMSTDSTPINLNKTLGETLDLTQTSRANPVQCYSTHQVLQYPSWWVL